MAEIISGFSGHWLLIGDLNNIVSNLEKKRGEVKWREFFQELSEFYFRGWCYRSGV